MKCVADIEADGLLDTATRIWCAVFKDVDTGKVYKFYPWTGGDWYKQLFDFMDGCDTLIMHNGINYDMPLLRKLFGYKYKGNLIDTLIMSRLQNPKRYAPPGCKGGPHSVEAWGMRFGVPKPEHEDWSKFSEDMLHRCEQDVEIQTKIYRLLSQESKEKGWSKANKLTQKLFEILQLQEEYGWLVDRPYMDKCISLLTHWMDRIDKAVDPHLPYLCVAGNPLNKPFNKNGAYSVHCKNYMEETGILVNGPFSRVDFRKVDLGSNDQVKDYLLSEGWIPQEWNMKDGVRTSPKMSHKEEFNGLEGGIAKLIARRVQCRHRRSQIEGWLKAIRPDGRISQRITGIAATGRLKHGTIVNVPNNESFFGKQMRKIFIAKEGYKLVGVDSAGCQNRMLAARVGDPAFTETLLRGNKQDKTSIHYVNMKAIKEHAGIDVPYNTCKNLNYAFMFGAQDPKLAAVANVPQNVGKKIRKGLLSVAPGFEELIESLTNEWRRTAKATGGKFNVRYQNGTIRGLDGRPVLIEKEHTLLVYMLQSDEAIMMQYALCFLYKWITDKGWVHGREYGFVANIHDEFQAEVREDLAEEFAALGEKAISTAGRFLEINCPHEGEADIGTNWYETH